MKKETIGIIGDLSIEKVTLELENWIPMKETSEQNQAYCSVQRMDIKLNSCLTGTENEDGCSRIKPTDIITLRKSPDVRIENKIGEFFRGLNFIAYKFTNSTLNKNVLSELLGYIFMFEADFLVREHDGGPDNVTITLVVDEKPSSLIEKMESRGKVEEKGDRIFRFNYGMDFQVIVLEELPAKEKAWLESLMEH